MANPCSPGMTEVLGRPCMRQGGEVGGKSDEGIGKALLELASC